MRGGAQGLNGPIRGACPAEASFPDIGVIGRGAFAAGEPCVGLVETTRSDGQVGECQPDAVIVGRDLFGLCQSAGHTLDLIRVAVETPNCPEHLGWLVCALGVRL